MSVIWLKKSIGFHVEYSSFLSNLREAWTYSTNFGKYWNIKFLEDASSGSSKDGRTKRHDEAILDFQNIAKAPKTWWTNGLIEISCDMGNFTNNLIHFIFHSYRTTVTVTYTKSYTLFCGHLELFLKYL